MANQRDRKPRSLLAVALFLISLIAILMATAAPARAAGATYYVDCGGGQDSNSGLGTGQAWRSLDKANEAPLQPGDSLLFARGCTWTGTLRAGWNGTAASPITIGAYGSGARPRIINGPNDLDDGYHNNVEISGSYQVIDSIETTIVNPPVNANCANNPVGFFIGFNFRNPDNLGDGGSYNTLRNSKATGHTAGVHTNSNTRHNRILSSEFRFNRAMHKLTPVSVGAHDDIGAWGILLRGDNHEVAYNQFEANQALCTFDTPPQGNAVELYEARNNNIHHNVSLNDRDFSELGGTAAIRSADNTFAYNLVVSNVEDAHFIITRGSGNGFGPVWRTRLYNNTVYYTGSQSEGVICGAGCNGQMLTARNNILWAELKPIFADGAFNESHNIYWSSNGDPLVQFMGFEMNASSRIAHPRFVNPAGQDFRLQADSPAIDNGASEAVAAGYTSDLDNNVVPAGAQPDRGAYEFGGAVASDEPPATVYVQDDFERSESGGWGSAPTGGVYSLLWGDNARHSFGIDGHRANVGLRWAGLGREAVLEGVSAQNVDITFRFKSNQPSINDSQDVLFMARRLNNNNMYRGRVRLMANGDVLFQANKAAGGQWSTIGPFIQIPGVSHTPGAYLWLRAQVVGSNPTTIQIKIWGDGQPEPAGWQQTLTDGEPVLQAAGGFGLRVFLQGSAPNPPVVFTFDDLRVAAP